MSWQTFFQDLLDFSINRRKKYNLLDILVISVCALVCGADDFEDITIYGTQKESFLKTFLELPNGVPSHDTISRVLKFLDKEAFAESPYCWSKEILSTLNEQYTQINIDGKVLRATAKSVHKKLGFCQLSAWVSDHKLILGQQKVDSKSNEKTTVPDLLKSLDLKYSIVTILMQSLVMLKMRI